MKREKNVFTYESYKYKSRLNIHGGKQEYTKNFYETCPSVINWSLFACF